MKLLLATGNKGKVKEMAHSLQGVGVEILSLEAFPDLKLPPEHGRTFEENALIKARYCVKATGITALADDSGLEVDFLGKRPGVFSARYAGEDATDLENNDRLLKELKGVPPEKRGARFVCVLALVTPSGDERTFEGVFHGLIAEAARGENGFGYDPVFYIPRLKKTAGELTLEEKALVSHRARALGKLKQWLTAGA